MGRGTMQMMEADVCRRPYEELCSQGPTFRSAPEGAPWGVPAVFEDLCGNQFNLVERRPR
jgi:hypothetical protein